MRIRPPRLTRKLLGRFPTINTRMFVERYYYGLGWEDYQEHQATVTATYSPGDPGDYFQPPEPAEFQDIEAKDENGNILDLTEREQSQAETALWDALDDAVDSAAVDMAIDQLEAREA